jgi:5'-3' exonuclease
MDTPGIPGIGAVGAAKLLNQYGAIENFPPAVLGERRDLAILFKDLATLRRMRPLFDNVDELRWTGPTDAFDACSQRMETPAAARACTQSKDCIASAGPKRKGVGDRR